MNRLHETTEHYIITQLHIESLLEGNIFCYLCYGLSIYEHSVRGNLYFVECCRLYENVWVTKLHMDQNEKLCMFGVTHVIAIDGFSKKIVGHSSMPIKNNLTIYEEVYK